MKITATVFADQTYFEFFEPEKDRIIRVHKPDEDYFKATQRAIKEIESHGLIVVDTYFELNEFGDSITCLFGAPWAVQPPPPPD